MTEFLQVDEFAKDLKKLRKKFRNIDRKTCQSIQK